jgi:hypothetical protein
MWLVLDRVSTRFEFLHLPFLDFVYLRHTRRIAGLLTHLLEKMFIEHDLEPLSALVSRSTDLLCGFCEEAP